MSGHVVLMNEKLPYLMMSPTQRKRRVVDEVVHAHAGQVPAGQISVASVWIYRGG